MLKPHENQYFPRDHKSSLLLVMKHGLDECNSHECWMVSVTVDYLSGILYTGKCRSVTKYQYNHPYVIDNTAELSCFLCRRCMTQTLSQQTGQLFLLSRQPCATHSVYFSGFGPQLRGRTHPTTNNNRHAEFSQSNHD